jgi:heme-based aerotactic transducer
MADSSQYGPEDFPRGGLDEQLDADSLGEENDQHQSEIRWQKDVIGSFDNSIRRPRTYRDSSADAARQMANDIYENQTNDNETVE